MLDIITTVSDHTPVAWVQESLQSVRIAAEHAGFPVNLITVPGVPGHIGQAMMNGMAQATSEYVAWVDDDDFVLPNAFRCLRQHLDPDHPSQRPYDAVCAREIHLLANGRFLPHYGRHHFTAYRRSIVSRLDLTPYPSHPNALMHKMCPRVAHELSWVYVYRIYLSQGLALRSAATPAERDLIA